MMVDEKAIGLMIVVLQNGEELAEISAIYLLENYSGKGYGKLLLNWGLDRIKELGYKNVFLWVLKENLNAIRFYERLGFLFDGTEREITRGKSLMQLRAQK
jgi:ribosomal protein S18 acetylase RimI-like enzyme